MDSRSSNSGGNNGGDGDGEDPSAKSRVEQALETLRAAGHRDRLVLVPPDDDAAPKDPPRSAGAANAGDPKGRSQTKAALAKTAEREKDKVKHLAQINFVTTDDPTLRKLIRDIADAIATNPGVAAAVDALLGNERLRKLVLALLAKAGGQPDDAAPGDGTALLELLAAIANDPELRQACAFVAADDALRSLCIALSTDPKWIKAFARTMSDGPSREFFERMWAADAATQQNLVAALSRPELLKLVVTDCSKKQTEAAVRIAIGHPEAPALGVRVLRLRGLPRLVVHETDS